jgi:hypothetical protein
MARVCVETNATLVKAALTEDSYRLSAAGGIITEMKHVMSLHFVSCKVSVCKRDSNKVAHNLAAFGCTLPSGQMATLDDAPHAIEVLLTSNLAGSNE